jgi:hypothetical protein
MVAGDICEAAPDVVAGVGVAEAETVLETSNGFDEEDVLKPVDFEADLADDPRDVSALRASMAADAAPIANNMA